MLFDFLLTGRTPLLLHADNLDFSDEIKLWQRDSANKSRSVPGDDRSPAFTWVGSCYHDGEQLVMPTDNLQSCLKSAGSKVIFKRQTTYKELAVAGLWLEPQFMPLLVGDPGQPVPWAPVMGLKNEPDYREHLAAVRRMGFDLMARRAKIGTSKHVRVRPVFAAWSLAGTVEIVNPDITPDALKDIFRIAGSVGLGDWRPGCKTPGRYGQFGATVKAAKGKRGAA